jgi:dTDP-4-dehydrorhamnose 3,5-epimerase
MNVVRTELPGVLVLEPKVFRDHRGFFLESWNARWFADAVGSDVRFVQDNHSRSGKHVLRGVHYQLAHPQGKLIRVVAGEVLDVAVDLRRSSPHFGRWVAVRLSGDNHRQMWIPPGFGHGFVALTDSADVLYKTTDYWHPEHERTVAWNDGQLAIDWQLGGATPVLAAKDAAAPALRDAEVYD